jgi:hypothetical protein
MTAAMAFATATLFRIGGIARSTGDHQKGNRQKALKNAKAVFQVRHVVSRILSAPGQNWALGFR